MSAALYVFLAVVSLTLCQLIQEEQLWMLDSRGGGSHSLADLGLRGLSQRERYWSNTLMVVGTNFVASFLRSWKYTQVGRKEN